MSGDVRARVAQGAILLGLLCIAMLAARWQPGPWWMADPPVSRMWASAGVLTGFLALCAWPVLRRRRARIDTASEGNVLVAWASQTGFAAELAEHTAQVLRGAGRGVRVVPLDGLDATQLADAEQAVFVVSTTGEGDPPDHATRFVQQAMRDAPALGSLRYAVLALGDRHYARFCAFGRVLDAWLLGCGARPMFDRIEVDAGDDGALRHWQHQLAHIAGVDALPDWAPPRYGAWRIVARRELNPGSLGAPVFHVELVPESTDDLDWQAGDIAEIGPCNPPDAVEAWLASTGMDGDARVASREGENSLRELLSRSVLPPHADQPTRDAAALSASLKRLPHREYSIASLPADGALHLLVRQARRDDGHLGLGSGWLTAHAAPGATIAARIRRNPSFHAPADAPPMLLIGNGTGIAGLRSLLKARIAAGRTRNWLLFGERQRALDLHYADELHAWHAAGAIERMDLVFSRDPATADAPRYVQHRLRECGTALRQWVDDGAAIYVCGSLDGMAPGVDAALREVLGDATVAELAASGRYRRDVY